MSFKRSKPIEFDSQIDMHVICKVIMRSSETVYFSHLSKSRLHICVSANKSTMLLIQSKNSRPLCDIAYAWSFCGNLNQLSKNTTSVHNRPKWERNIKYKPIGQAIFWREIVQCWRAMLSCYFVHMKLPSENAQIT